MASLPPLPSPRYAKSLLTALTSSTPPQEPLGVTSTITTLNLQPHPEGGFFVETDRDSHLVPNPFLDNKPDKYNNNPAATNVTIDENSAAYNYEIATQNKKDGDRWRNASTTIHYYLTPSSPLGRFHRNKARTVHALHWGRGAYVVIHPDQFDSHGNPRIETFVVGTNVANGEKVQWIVEGGKYKASYLLPDNAQEDGVTADPINGYKGSETGLLISETVVPGFEYMDHDFLTAEGLNALVGVNGAWGMRWLLGKEEKRWNEIAKPN